MRALALIAAAVVLLQASPNYEIYAVRFAHVAFAESSLIAGAAKGPQIDIAFAIWPVIDRTANRTILVDAGFYRDKFLSSWKPQDYVRPSDALKTALGIAPEGVTDIIVTHSHWDHFDGADLFPKATIWIQKAEFDYYLTESGEVKNRGGLDVVDAPVLAKLNADGRLKLIDGDNQAILPGIRVYTGGKHTFESQYVGVTTRDGVFILASDNAYLYKNLDEHLAIAQTLDAQSNLAAQTRMLDLAGGVARVIPGHDPAVFTRFPAKGANTVRIH